MGVKTEQTNHLKEIRTFLTNHLSHSSYDQDLIDKIFEHLRTKGKIFSNQENSFSWGLFFMHVSSLTASEDTCNRSLYAIAAAIELLILATDIVDEIIDDDNDLMKSMSLPEAIIISNALLIDAFDLILKYTPKALHAALTNVFQQLKTACNGEWQELKLTIKSTIPSEQDYFRVIRQKSSSLIQLVCALAHPKQPELLSRVATNIGVAGQLKNDANDIFLDSKTDLIRKKATLPVIKAIEFSLETDNGLLLKKFHELTQHNKALKEEIRNYIKNTGAIDYCIILSNLYIKQAVDELCKIFPHKQTELNILKDYLDG